jgi:hypothetical protein
MVSNTTNQSNIVCKSVTLSRRPHGGYALLGIATFFGCSSTTSVSPSDAMADVSLADVVVKTDVRTMDVAQTNDASVEDVLRVPDAITRDVMAQDTAVGNDAAKDVGLVITCTTTSIEDPLVESRECTATQLAITPTELCGSARCPVLANVALRCPMLEGYGPRMVANNAAATVLFTTNQGSFVPRVFTVSRSGAPRVEETRGIDAVPRIAVDAMGNRVLVVNELPGVAIFRDTGDGVARMQPRWTPRN